MSSCTPDTSCETPLPHLTLSTRIRNSGQSFSSLLLFVGCTSSYLWHVGSSSLTRDRILGPLHWEHRVLAPGPRRKSHHSYFSLPVSDTVSLLSPKANIMVSCQTTVSHPAQHKIIQLLRLPPQERLCCLYPPTSWVLQFAGHASLGLTSRHTDRLAPVPGISHHLTFSSGYRRPPQYHFMGPVPEVTPGPELKPNNPRLTVSPVSGCQYQGWDDIRRGTGASSTYLSRDHKGCYHGNL